MAAVATTSLFMPPLVLLLLLHSPSSTAAEPPSSGGSSSNTATPATSVSPTLGAVLIVFVGLFFLSGLFFVALRRIIDSGCCGLRRGRVSLGGGGGPGRVRVPEGLSREAVQAIPTYFYKDVKMHRRVGKGELECAVCLSEFEDHEALRLLPKCSHVFHLNCVDPWLLSQATCPVCRTVLQPSKSMESEASDEHPDHVITIDHCPPLPPASNHSRLSDPDRRTEESSGSNSPEPHSTGHSPIWTVGRDDRFTLTLPAGEAATATWQRAMSQRKGYRATISWCCRAGLNRESEPDVSGFGGSCRVHTAPVSPVSDPTGVGYISS